MSHHYHNQIDNLDLIESAKDGEKNANGMEQSPPLCSTCKDAITDLEEAFTCLGKECIERDDFYSDITDSAVKHWKTPTLCLKCTNRGHSDHRLAPARDTASKETIIGYIEKVSEKESWAATAIGSASAKLPLIKEPLTEV